MTELHGKKCDGFLLMYSITNVSSFEAIQFTWDWLFRLRDDKKPPAVLVGMKSDLENDRVVCFLPCSTGVPFCGNLKKKTPTRSCSSFQAAPGHSLGC